jgi:hypothetical protein
MCESIVWPVRAEALGASAQVSTYTPRKNHTSPCRRRSSPPCACASTTRRAKGAYLLPHLRGDRGQGVYERWSLPTASLPTLRLSPLSNLYPLSQLERASGVMAMSLSAGACCPLPCQHCLCKRHMRCLGRETEGLWYKTCWRQWKEKACACCSVLGNAQPRGDSRASASRTAALWGTEDRPRPGSPRVVNGEEGDDQCNCEPS